MDRVFLEGIEVFAFGGVTDSERIIGQRYRLDISLLVDLTPASASDNLADTVSYAEIHDLAVRTIRDRPFNLVESAASRVADAILEGFPAQSVTIKLRKLLPPIDGVVAAAGVVMTRSRGRV